MSTARVWTRDAIRCVCVSVCSGVNEGRYSTYLPFIVIYSFFFNFWTTRAILILAVWQDDVQAADDELSTCLEWALAFA